MGAEAAGGGCAGVGEGEVSSFAGNIGEVVEFMLFKAEVYR